MQCCHLACIAIKTLTPPYTPAHALLQFNVYFSLMCVLQFLRVRTVSGITYHCRSGKTFKGQMMDRFLLTDCRAVLSGNYR